MATYWENSCSFGLRYVSWYEYLIVSLVFSHLGFWSGNLFLIAPFPDLCLLVPFYEFSDLCVCIKSYSFLHINELLGLGSSTDGCGDIDVFSAFIEVWKTACTGSESKNYVCEVTLLGTLNVYNKQYIEIYKFININFRSFWSNANIQRKVEKSFYYMASDEI